MRKLDKAKTSVFALSNFRISGCDMSYVREVTETDFYSYVRLYFRFDSIYEFLSLFELEKP